MVNSISKFDWKSCVFFISCFGRALRNTQPESHSLVCWTQFLSTCYTRQLHFQFYKSVEAILVAWNQPQWYHSFHGDLQCYKSGLGFSPGVVYERLTSSFLTPGLSFLNLIGVVQASGFLKAPQLIQPKLRTLF